MENLKENSILCKKCNKPKNVDGLSNPRKICKCGRPSIYNKKLLKSAYKYLNLEMPHKGKDKILEVFHSIEGLASWLDIDRSTIYAWTKDKNKEEFSDIVGRILTKQALFLLNNGLIGNLNTSITILMLGKHGYSNKTDNYIHEEVHVDPEDRELARKAIDEFLKSKNNRI